MLLVMTLKLPVFGDMDGGGLPESGGDPNFSVDCSRFELSSDQSDFTSAVPRPREGSRDHQSAIKTTPTNAAVATLTWANLDRENDVL